MLRFGPATGPIVVVALPLFEEANRVRAFAVAICRALAERGVASVLPDLPGQGESLTPTRHLRLEDLRGAFSASVDRLYHDRRRPYSMAFRSGAIVSSDAHSLGRWFLSPISGNRLVADLARVLAATERKTDAALVRSIFQADDHQGPLEIAGNLLEPAFLQDLTVHHESWPTASVGVPTRVVRLDKDAGEATRHVPGTPLWRRAEPGNDLALAALLADDIADWIAACEG